MGLIEHNATSRDDLWSNNSDGEGANWLGMLLMLLRDHLTGKTTWTHFIENTCGIDVATGPSLMPNPVWQQAVIDATASMQSVLSRVANGNPPTPNTKVRAPLLSGGRKA